MSVYREMDLDKLDARELKSEVAKQQNIVRELYTIIVRALVVLKQLTRVGAVAATYIWLGPKLAYFLAGFIAVIAVWQLTIDKARKIVHPDLKLSEWNVL